MTTTLIEGIDPHAVEPVADDLFIFAPSFVFAEMLRERGLDEGKSLGTASEIDLLFLDLDQTIGARTDPAKFQHAKKSGQTVGKRVLKQVQAEIGPKILSTLNRHLDGGFNGFNDFKKAAVAIMKPAWKRVFEAGVRSAGIEGTGKGSKGKPLVKLDPEDEKWLKSAMQHEMKFLNGMLKAVHDESFKMPLPQRVQMYVRTLESFYDSARVIGLPATVIMHWSDSHDDRTCPGCEYLFKHSPYTKNTLPTTPRSGATQCLSNCRQRLVIRQSSPEKVIALTNKSKSRDAHIRNLRKLKSKGHL